MRLNRAELLCITGQGALQEDVLRQGDGFGTEAASGVVCTLPDMGLVPLCSLTVLIPGSRAGP